MYQIKNQLAFTIELSIKIDDYLINATDNDLKVENWDN